MGASITIKQMSKLSGFSVATVSKALNDRPDISEKVKRQIKVLAKNVNYIPNRFAAALRIRKTNIIAVIVPKINDSNYARLISEVQKSAYQKGIRLMVLQSSLTSIKELDCVNSICDGSVDGVIILREKSINDVSFHQSSEILESNVIPNVIVKVESSVRKNNNLKEFGIEMFQRLFSKINMKRNSNQLN